MTKFLEFNIQTFAHKKGQSSTSNGRDSAGRRLGAKAADGEYIEAGSIIYRQRGTKIHPGKNVGRGTDDTLFAKITPCLENGKTGFVMGLAEGEIAGGSTEFIVLRSKILTPHYVYCIARSYYFRQTAILSMNGADGRQRVDEGKLKSTKVLRPTKTVLDRFEKIVSPIFDIIFKLTQKNKVLTEQRDLLLPRLMSGKLEV